MSAVIFGSISTLADTSELQRAAFNAAFAEHGLDWQWGQEEYRTLLGSNGGAARIAAYADERGETVDADAVHATKSANFQAALAASAVQPRAGVVETIRAAKAAGYGLGFATTTSPDNIDALFAALAPELEAGDFDVVLSSADGVASKPDPAVYLLALERLGESAAACVAIEDNEGGAKSAAAAGITCVGFPNENTAQLDLAPATPVVSDLEFGELSALVPAAGRA